MSDKTLQDLKVDAHIAVLHTKVDALIEKQKELTARVRANEKVVAAVTLLGTVALAVIGAGYFAPKAEAEIRDDKVFPDPVPVVKEESRVAHMGHTFPTAGEWINDLRQWESEQNRTPIDESINNAIGDFYWEDSDGSDDPTKQEELLQLPSN